MEQEHAQLETPGNVLAEAILAAAALSRWSLLGESRAGDAEQRARAMVFVPVIAFAAGVVFALIDHALGAMLAPLARSIAIFAVMEIAAGAMDLFGIADTVEAIRQGSRPASTGLARIGPLGAAVAIGWLAAAVYLLSRIVDPAGRSSALVMATMLSRWAIVPVGYGLKPLERWGLGIPYEGGIRFREFAASSAVALGITMGLYENIGLAVIVAVALAILAMRLLLSRRAGGVGGYSLAGAMAVCELVVLGVLAALRV
jgi:cobalamin synthase